MAVVLATVVTSGLLFWLSLDQARWFLLCFALLDAALLSLVRLCLRPLSRLHSQRRRVLVVGTGRLAFDAVRAVRSRRSAGLELVGIVSPARQALNGDDEEVAERKQLHFDSLLADRQVGEVLDVPQIVRDEQVDLVLIALSSKERYYTSWVMSSLAHSPVQLYILPDAVPETAKVPVEMMDGIPSIGLTEPAISGGAARLKRALDLIISIPIALALVPFMAVIALVIRLESRGPAIFRQERIGQYNRRFVIYKFRTMRSDADQHTQDMIIQTRLGMVHKRRGDPRITRIGAMLRRASLDELPQLVNVIKGEMSLVGPRPELPWIVERYQAWQYSRLLVPQGITGWWQVNGRSDRTLHLHTQDDLFYVRNYSFWLDIKILLMTIGAVFRGNGAF
jgi:exopolysaccharide biosynthesis polyprenyl glycosylphosphotransferase